MRKSRVVMNLSISMLILLGLFASTFACGNNKPVNNLPDVEVRQYEGKDLSSIKDFRENSIKGPQYIDLQSYRLKVSGLVDNPGEYTYDEIINNHPLYKKVVTLDCVEGWGVTILWEGVLVADLINAAKASADANTVIFHAYDGYTTSLPLDYLINQNIVMAYKMNDVLIPPERGAPFHLVAESKWGYKWIKWITEIELSNDPNYQGYWESRGYSDSGDMDKSFLD